MFICLVRPSISLSLENEPHLPLRAWSFFEKGFTEGNLHSGLRALSSRFGCLLRLRFLMLQTHETGTRDCHHKQYY